MNTTRHTAPHSAAGEFGATSTRHESRIRYPIWLWLNLLSLDAPAVAVAWCALLARSRGLTVEPVVLVILASVVWAIYTADRLFDVRSAIPATSRHRFARAHRVALLLPLVAAVLLSLSLSTLTLPLDTLLRGLVAAVGVALYFYWVHGPRSGPARPGVKRLAVSMLFAFGVILPLQVRGGLMTAWATTAAVVCLNTFAIDRWECGGNAGRGVAFGCAATGIWCLLLAGSSEYYAALALGAFLIGGLDGLRERLSRDVLRVAADLALLAPALVMLLR